MHTLIILTSTAISLHILPILFYLINHKTTEFFEEWNLFSYSVVFKFIKSECKLKKF